ncbi:MAG TPA: ATP-binding protein [Gemmatimonadaceae bacterium]|nr:ATP-binding protein [Gemmatimonadaceae bacterium]
MPTTADKDTIPPATTPSAFDWLVGGGELGALIRAKDWSTTPLGTVDTWPQSLRSAVSILLPSRAQICLFWGPELVAIYNDAYRPALGDKHPWALGRPAREVWNEIWEDVLRSLLESVLHTGETFWASDFIFFLERHGYAEETYFDISYDPVRDETGRVGGVFCIVSETTGRVLGERRLRVLRDLGRVGSEARSVGEVFRQAAAVLDQYPHDIAFAGLFERDGRAAASVRLEALDGWPLDESLRGGYLVLDDDALGAFPPLSGGAWPEHATAAVILPVAVPAQAPDGFLVAGVSPRLELDDRYRDFLRLVASSIASAVAAARVLETQRARAEALAEIDRAKTAFFSNVSHEFRTPLTLMLGPLEDLLRDRDEALLPSHREALTVVQRNSVRLLKLVNTLLDFSQIEAGRASAAYEPVDLPAFTAELASNFRSACERAGLVLRVECPPLPQPVWVDRSMWEKIVLNLLSNALKFTFEGEIAVTVTDRGESAELKVRDTGGGIPAHEIPRLFERFHRVEGARARTHEGSGIGLALVSDLVRLHKGNVHAASETGQGSIFTVSLRYGHDHLPSEQLRTNGQRAVVVTPSLAYVEEALGWIRDVSAAREPGPAASRTPGAGARILIADDNGDMRDYLARLLGEHWQVAAVADGVAALDRLAHEDFDVVISDVMMPQMDGFALLRNLRSDPRYRDLRIILLSARAGEESRIEGLGAGADDYVVKPFSAAQLIAQVNAQLTIQRTRRESAREREQLLAREDAALREAELQRQHRVSLFTHAPNPIVILRGAGHVIELANPPACRVLGRPEADIVGRPLLDALPELRGQALQQALDEVVRTGESYERKEVTTQLDRRGDGTLDTVYLNFVCTPFRGITGTVEGVLVTAFEVTREVLASREMNRLRAEAEIGSRAKDEFLAMLSHELRNPLAPIVMALRLIRMGGRESPELDIIERQANHLTRLVDDLLDVARITRRRIELRMRVIELSEVLDKALEIASPLLEQRRQTVDVDDVPRRGLPVQADPERLAQVVSNLLTNAAKYSEPGSRITVKAGAVDRHVQLSVRDRGIGIEPGMLHQIFELFVQQAQSIERAHGGLGLGLAIARHLAELHGGTLRAHSDGPGKGSEFVLQLPRADSALAVQEVTHAAMNAPQATVAKRILVVDDNQDAAATLGALLQNLGHVVETAYDGPAGLVAADRLHPDVAFIDIGLPGIDGYEVARQLRKRSAGRTPLLVAVTGYGLAADRDRATDAGFDHHLVKPVELPALQRVLAGG